MDNCVYTQTKYHEKHIESSDAEYGMYGNKVCVINKFHTDLITQVLWDGMSLHVTQAN